MNVLFLENATVIINILALLIVGGMLAGCLIRGRTKHLEDRILIALLIAIGGLAIANTLYDLIIYNGYFMNVSAGVMIVDMLINPTSFILLFLYVAILSGNWAFLQKKPALWIAPIVLECVVIALRVISYRVEFSLFNIALYDLRWLLYYVSVVIQFLFVVAFFCMLWKIDRILTVMPAMLMIIWVYFRITLDKISISAFLLAFLVLYLYLSVEKPGILVHIGGIILTMFTMITLIIGNAVTSAAFSSYLKTIHDRNEEHLKEVEGYMNEYEALPWLLDYFVDNADAVKAELKKNGDNVPEAFVYGRKKRITTEEAEGFDPEMKLLFASCCYKDIDDKFVTEFEAHNLDDLFLLAPPGEEDAVIIFDAERNDDGSLRLGDFRNVFEEKLEWDNYNDVVNGKISWIWGNYHEQDDFGFYRMIPMGSRGNAFLCNSFQRKEVYIHLDFISSSRKSTMLFLTISVAIVLLLLYFMIVRPLSVMGQSVKKYQKDKNPEAVEADMALIKGRNEIGDFAREFSSLAVEMDRYTKEVAQLAGEKERVNAELNMASFIQEEALPAVTSCLQEIKDFDIYASMKPAKAVGGDFYDFFMVDDRHIAFLIADVSDKGVPAALFMMSAKNLLNYRTRQGGTPGEIFSEVNSHLARDNQAMMFVTVWMGILDLDTGIVACANAGHEPPAIWTAERGFYLWVIDDHEPALGIRKDMVYTDYEVRLDRGDCIFLYTDGVTDAMDASEVFYGMDRLKEALGQVSDRNPENIVQAVDNSIVAFVKDADQFDDKTMLCIRYNGCGDKE